VDTGISLVFGTLGYDMALLSDLRNSRFLCFFLLWSYFGILIGNSYLAQLTESLVAPIEISPLTALEEIVDQNYTILLLSEPKYEEISPPPPQSSLRRLQLYLYYRCQSGSDFCTKLIVSQMKSVIASEKPTSTSYLLTYIISAWQIFSAAKKSLQANLISGSCPS